MLARVPWTPTLKAEAKPRPRQLNKGKRRHLVETVATILKTGEPTHFAFEASCRHGIRSGLCLDGWTWAEADAAAADVVGAALRQIGAKRPTWQQGQPEYTQQAVLATLRVSCVNCGKPLPEALGDKPRTFCSSLCANASRMRRYRRDNEAEHKAYQKIWADSWSAKQPEVRCFGCNTMFRPKWPRTPPPKYCSPDCYQFSRRRRFICEAAK